MSIQTWKDEFYPIPAGRVLLEEALEHSLQKWEGFRKENLERHEVEMRSFSWCLTEMKSGQREGIATSLTCALCHLYAPEEGCQECPLYKVRGVKCFASADEYISPHHAFLEARDPEPMIALIKEAIRRTEHLLLP